MRIGKGHEAPAVRHFVCSHPNCRDERVEAHHIVRRSHLSGVYDAVEIDGRVVSNIATLCSLHHRKVTENHARIVWENGDFCWQEGDGAPSYLTPQPSLVGSPRKDKTGPLYSRHFHRADNENTEECPKCHGKGKVPKKSEDEEEKPKRKYKTWSMGIPVDAGEDGYEVWKTQLELCSEKIQKILDYTDTVPPYYVLVAVTTDWLNSQGGDE